ncbi:MAG: PAS domain-containing protein [Deltaproteobacteria bacterium]|nr:PAS domain-containing protein [Deltaproteobacteria bacterium]
MKKNVQFPASRVDSASLPTADSSDPDNILTLDTLQLVVESMPVGVYIFDKRGRIVYANETGRQIWEGIKYVGPSDFHEYKAWWYDSGKEIGADEWAGSRAIRNGEVSIDEEIRIRCFDGSEKIILNSALPLFDHNEKIVGAIATNRDITRQKRDEGLIRQSEERFRRMLDQLMEGVQIIGFDWRYLYINNAAEIHNRRPSGDLLGQKYMDMWPEIEETQVFRVIHKCMVERIPQQLENRFIFPGGEEGWFDLRIQPVKEGVLILSLDNTDRRESEARLHQHQRLESLGYLAGGHRA